MKPRKEAAFRNLFRGYILPPGGKVSSGRGWMLLPATESTTMPVPARDAAGGFLNAHYRRSHSDLAWFISTNAVKNRIVKSVSWFVGRFSRSLSAVVRCVDPRELIGGARGI